MPAAAVERSAREWGADPSRTSTARAKSAAHSTYEDNKCMRDNIAAHTASPTHKVQKLQIKEWHGTRPEGSTYRSLGELLHLDF